MNLEKESEIKFEEYEQAVIAFAEVSKGGAFHTVCSFKDIAIRQDRLQEAKHNLILALGTELFEKLMSGREDNA